MSATTKPESKESDEAASLVQPAVRPVRMTLFPTLDSLGSVLDLGTSQLPIETSNQLVCLLMTYHNSLLKQIEESNNNEKSA